MNPTVKQYAIDRLIYRNKVVNYHTTEIRDDFSQLKKRKGGKMEHIRERMEEKIHDVGEKVEKKVEKAVESLKRKTKSLPTTHTEGSEGDSEEEKVSPESEKKEEKEEIESPSSQSDQPQRPVLTDEQINAILLHTVKEFFGSQREISFEHYNSIAGEHEIFRGFGILDYFKNKLFAPLLRKVKDTSSFFHLY